MSVLVCTYNREDDDCCGINRISLAFCTKEQFSKYHNNIGWYSTKASLVKHIKTDSIEKGRLNVATVIEAHADTTEESSALMEAEALYKEALLCLGFIQVTTWKNTNTGNTLGLYVK